MHFLFICLSDESLSLIFVQLLANLPLIAVEEADCSRLEDASDVFSHTTNTCKKNLFKLDRLQHKTKSPGKGKIWFTGGCKVSMDRRRTPGLKGHFEQGKKQHISTRSCLSSCKPDNLKAVVARSFGVGEVRLEWSGGPTPGIKMSPYSSDGSYENALCLGNTCWLLNTLYLSMVTFINAIAQSDYGFRGPVRSAPTSFHICKYHSE